MTTATTIEKNMLEIARALRAIDKDPDTIPGTWEIPALPMCSVDVDFIRACSPDNIRALLHVARMSHHLAWALAGAADKLASIEDATFSTLMLIDEADAALKAFRECFGKPMHPSPVLKEDRIMKISDEIHRGIGLGRKAWKDAPVKFARALESECAALWGITISPSQCPSAPHAPAEAQPAHPDSDPHRASPGTMIQPIEPSSRT